MMLVRAWNARVQFARSILMITGGHTRINLFCMDKEAVMLLDWTGLDLGVESSPKEIFKLELQELQDDPITKNRNLHRN